MRVAAGPLGVQAALSHSFKEMGVVRSMTALLDMNQQDGFSCPSCAWPDPEDRSKLGEYCENGAKAVAEDVMESRSVLIAARLTRSLRGKAAHITIEFPGKREAFGHQIRKTIWCPISVLGYWQAIHSQEKNHGFCNLLVFCHFAYKARLSPPCPLDLCFESCPCSVFA